MRLITSIIATLLSSPVYAQPQAAPETLFTNVRVFDGTTPRLSAPTSVLVRGNTIAAIGPEAVSATTASPQATVIQGNGRTLMPGLIDVHVHLVFSSMTMMSLLAPDLTPESAFKQAEAEAGRMLLRGFTAVRDVGGPVFPLKAGIDAGRFPGPRIWPSGAVISQTSGHGDFRLPSEPSRRFTGQLSRAEKLGATFIADGRDDVLTAVRENLRFGASQLKLMAGGGTSSAYDPVDVTQYTPDEMKAAVEAAEDWGTYVTVHAYTPRAIRRALEAGVRSVEHGQLLDEPTLKLMKAKDVILSLQVLIDNNDSMDENRRIKRAPVLEGQAKVWPLAKRLGVKLAWGTDFLFQPEINGDQNQYITALKPWFSPAEILKLVTHDNAQLLARSGLRSPYQGRLGVVAKGALADLLLVNGDPLSDIDLLARPETSFAVIMKDGVLHKNTY
ncbi:hydrolase [Polymorphobacter multimanifer]|uniref:Imidazolonepropionase-like amidohydrolase n=1 Tax=Polymorphobacter multimanifer TaxID=1070431 RepID=A0A841L865_9SPHN|nr:amidohydrolase family protein [Polymorphobacter multimanifer]MBB6227153.1 imidazolonepropionase-like amidohydrolase [Polymorphobacter multimanifer]GGI72483.1 hydrolase [Polymorphobacter multimanifer]